MVQETAQFTWHGCGEKDILVLEQLPLNRKKYFSKMLRRYDGSVVWKHWFDTAMNEAQHEVFYKEQQEPVISAALAQAKRLFYSYEEFTR